ncbi:MAG: DUF423 domain-containing protein [Pseudomonadota bacterium]
MILVAFAGLLGGTGVYLAYAAAHVESTDGLRAAAEMAMVHAVVVIGLVLVARQSAIAIVWKGLALAMLVGAGLFAGDVGLSTLSNIQLPRFTAPIGGVLTMIAWAGVFIAGLSDAWMGRRQ